MRGYTRTMYDYIPLQCVLRRWYDTGYTRTMYNYIPLQCVLRSVEE